MDGDLTHHSKTPALGALPRTRSPAVQPPAGACVSELTSIFDLYPRGGDCEMLGALRFAMEVEGIPAATLEVRAGLEQGAVDALLSGRARSSDDVVRRLCRSMGISRWLFFLVGSIKYGADLGLPELQWVIEEWRRMRAEGGSPIELVAEATRLFFKIGGRHI